MKLELIIQLAEARIQNPPNAYQQIVNSINRGEVSSTFLIFGILKKMLDSNKDNFNLTHARSLTFYNYEVLSENKFFSALSDTSVKRIFKYLNIGATEISPLKFTNNQENIILLAEKCLIELGYLDPKNSIISGYYFIDNGVFRTASLPHALGLIFLSDKFWSLNEDEMVIAIAHEIGHQELFLINTIDRLVNSSHDKNMIYAPLQQKNRPPIGRLHSFFALFRMYEVSKKLKLEIYIKKYRLLIEQNYNSLAQDEFTSFGNELIHSIWNRVHLV